MRNKWEKSSGAVQGRGEDVGSGAVPGVVKDYDVEYSAGKEGSLK